MPIGLPQIDIEFKSRADTVVQRSARGIVALILKDNTNTGFDTKEYSKFADVIAADWTASNLKFIEMVFQGSASKVICERLATNAVDDSAALERLAIKKWNYAAIPGATAAGAAVAASAVIGSGDNGTVTVTVAAAGRAGNTYTIQLVTAGNISANMSVALNGSQLVVTLGTDAAGALDPAKNTATLVAAAIDALAPFTAVASGTGATALDEQEAQFAGGVDAGDVVRHFALSDWIKDQRNNKKKTFKAVVYNVPADHEGIINFTTSQVTIDAATYTGIQYTARIAGVLAGLPLDNSATYYTLDEVDNFQESLDPDGDINVGKLILVKDNGVRIAREVNSKVTFTTAKGEDWRSIKNIEGMDMITEDIRDTFKLTYTGKVPNTYANKMIFVSFINSYFLGLAGTVLDDEYDNLADIDTVAQRAWLIASGVDVTNLSDMQVRKYNTGTKVFLAANIQLLSAMEDLAFVIEI